MEIRALGLREWEVVGQVLGHRGKESYLLAWPTFPRVHTASSSILCPGEVCMGPRVVWLNTHKTGAGVLVRVLGRAIGWALWVEVL